MDNIFATRSWMQTAAIALALFMSSGVAFGQNESAGNDRLVLASNQSDSSNNFKQWHGEKRTWYQYGQSRSRSGNSLSKNESGHGHSIGLSTNRSGRDHPIGLSVPEIDAGSGSAAIALLISGLLLAAERIRRSST